MKSIALVVGAVLAAGSAAAATGFENRPEPWNDVRNGLGWGENRWNWNDDLRKQRRYTQDWRGVAHECWNDRAHRFETVREGEFQDDLDYSRCRPLRQEVVVEYYPTYRYYY